MREKRKIKRLLLIVFLMLTFAGCQMGSNEQPKVVTNPEATAVISQTSQPEPSGEVPTKAEEPESPVSEIPTETPAKNASDERQEKEPEISGLPTQTPTITSTPTAAPTPVDEETVRNLNGFQLIIGKYSEITEASPEFQKKLNKVMEKYNFSVVEKQVGDLYSIGTQFAYEVKEGKPTAHVYQMSPISVTKPYTSSHCYDLATLKELDLNDPKWNGNVTELMTRGQKVYGVNIGPATPSIGVIFNRHMLEEAGIDPDLPYDLQKNGEWTWSKFRELCKKLTRDVNGDDLTDVYALSSQGSVMLTAFLASNQTQLFLKEDGTFMNNALSAECKEAVNFAIRLNKDGYVRAQEPGAEWDYFIRQFRDEKAAMQINYENVIGSTYADMKDKLGFVMVPKPDEAGDYFAISEENSYIIPACYDEKTASDIAFAFDLYMTAMYEAEMESLLAPYYEHFSDHRAVEETIPMMMEQDRLIPQNEYVIDGAQTSSLLWAYPFDDITWEKRAKELSTEWKDSLSLVNNGKFVERQPIASSTEKEEPEKKPTEVPTEVPTSIVYGYADSDIEAINAMIENNGLNAKKNDVEHWDFVTWGNVYPARVRELILREKGLSGKLDVSKLSELEYLACETNQLTEINVKGLKKLSGLTCYANRLTELDLSGVTQLSQLECFANQIGKLDVSKQKNLTRLACSDNLLSELDVSALSKLEGLWCDENKLTRLDLTSNQKLHSLNCERNQLSELKVNFLKRLTYLSCSWNQLKKLDISGMNKLEFFYCDNNQITELKLGGLTNLYWLMCGTNQLTSLDLKDLPSILSIGCDYNRITNLDLSGLSNLDSLNCDSNLLTTLDLSEQKKLRFLYCRWNKLTELDLRGLTSLVEYDTGEINVIR